MPIRAPEPQPSAPRRAEAEEVPLETLLARMARSDEAALVALYLRCGGPVLASCRRILGDVEEAREVASEAFWRIWRVADRYDPQRWPALPWILSVARHLALDRLRVTRRRAALREREGPGFADALAEDPAARLDPDDRLEVRRALARLSPNDRALLESTYFGGLSGADIAARDSLPLGTVKSRLRAALRRLRLSYRRGDPRWER